MNCRSAGMHDQAVKPQATSKLCCAVLQDHFQQPAEHNFTFSIHSDKQLSDRQACTNNLSCPILQDHFQQPAEHTFNSLIHSDKQLSYRQASTNNLCCPVLQDHFQQPAEHTFTSLIDACRRAEEQSLALKVYRNALSSGCTQSMMLYAAAMAACQHPVDLHTAMEIYGDMQA